MAPGVAGKLPAFILQSLGDDLGLFHILFPAEFRMFLQPLGLIAHQVQFVPVIRIGSVAEYAVIAGEGDHATGALVGTVGMLLQEGVQSGHHVKVADLLCAVRFYIVAFYFAVFVQHQLVRIAGGLIGVIIAQVIHRQHHRFFIRRQQQVVVGLKVYIAVLIRGFHHQIPEPHEHIPVVVHLLGNLVKLLHRGHPGVHAVHSALAQHRYIESAVRVIDERMVKNVRHGERIHRHAAVQVRLVLGDGLGDGGIGFIAGHALQQGDGALIIIAEGHGFRLGQHIALAFRLDFCNRFRRLRGRLGLGRRFRYNLDGIFGRGGLLHRRVLCAAPSGAGMSSGEKNGGGRSRCDNYHQDRDKQDPHIAFMTSLFQTPLTAGFRCLAISALVVIKIISLHVIAHSNSPFFDKFSTSV